MNPLQRVTDNRRCCRSMLTEKLNLHSVDQSEHIMQVADFLWWWPVPLNTFLPCLLRLGSSSDLYFKSFPSSSLWPLKDQPCLARDCKALIIFNRHFLASSLHLTAEPRWKKVYLSALKKNHLNKRKYICSTFLLCVLNKTVKIIHY